MRSDNNIKVHINKGLLEVGLDRSDLKSCPFLGFSMVGVQPSCSIDVDSVGRLVS